MNWNEVFEYNDGKLYWKITKGATKKEACAERIYLEVSVGNVTARHGV